MTKQCSVVFMDKFITGCNFHVDAGNVFAATKPLKHSLYSQNAHLNSKYLEYSVTINFSLNDINRDQVNPNDLVNPNLFSTAFL